jgi:hypothetical protein
MHEKVSAFVTGRCAIIQNNRAAFSPKRNLFNIPAFY